MPCQLSLAERRELADQATAAFEAGQAAYASVREAHARKLTPEAGALGGRAVEELPSAPLELSGTIDLFPRGDGDLVQSLRFIVVAIWTVLPRRASSHVTGRGVSYCPRRGAALINPAERGTA